MAVDYSKNPLDMSDAELESISLHDLEQPTPSEDNITPDQNESPSGDSLGDGTVPDEVLGLTQGDDGNTPDDGDEGTDVPDTNTADDTLGDSNSGTDVFDDKATPGEGDTSDGDSGDAADDGDTPKEQTDAEKQLAKLFAPFTANKRQMAVDNVEDAITLMQQGANYAKKMHQLKEPLKIIRMLENSGLLDESKLSFLIDVHNKDDGAIKKLIEDSGFDPLESSNVGQYEPKSHAVDDKTHDFQSALEDIKHTASFQRTANVISSELDEKSLTILHANPAVVSIINNHIADGTYDKIMGTVETERALNRLQGMSDIEAYKHVGDRLYGESPSAGDTPNAASTPQQNKASTPKTQSRRSAAAPSGNRAPVNKPADFNPLSLSDKQIEEMDIEKFLK